MEIIKSYVVDVYEDGSLKIREITGNNTQNKSKVSHVKESRRIFLTLKVLEYVRDYNDKHVSPRVALDAGIDKVRQEQGISRAAVIDKFCRQMGLKMKYWQNSVEKWIETGDHSEIREILLKNCCTGYEDFDTEAINEFFEKS